MYIRTDIVTACVDYTTRYLNGEGGEKIESDDGGRSIEYLFLKREKRRKEREPRHAIIILRQ